MLVRTPASALRDARTWAAFASVLAALGAYHLASIGGATDGLACSSFDNPTWTGAPNAVRVARSVTVDAVLTPAATQGAPFSTACIGWLWVDDPGDYTFVLGADDGGRLLLDNRLIINNDGPHGAQYKTETITLQPGAHALEVRYSQYGGDYALALLMGANGASPSPIPGHHLSRVPRVRMQAELQAWTPVLRPGLLGVAAAALLIAWRRLLWGAGRALADVTRGAHGWLVSPPRLALVVLIGLATAVRVVIALCSYAMAWPDTFAYYTSALAILDGNWFEHEIFRTPLYPAFMAGIFSRGVTPATGELVVLVQHTLGIVSTLLVYGVGVRTVGGGPAFYAALLWTLSPLTLYYESSIATESLFAMLVLFTLFWAVRLVGRQPSVLALAALGLTCGAATLTRPVGKALIVAIVGVLVVWTPRLRLRLVAVPLLTFLVVIAPWTYVNSRTYGFVGVSRGEGLGLFMRAFDVEHFPPPEQTQYPKVREAYLSLASVRPYLHYPVREELDFNQRLSALQTDAAMAGFALEAISEHPLEYAGGIARDWVLLFVAPHRSVSVCDASSGPHLCTGRTDGYAIGTFHNAPTEGYRRLKEWTAAFMMMAYPVPAFLAPLAALGALLLWRRAQGSTRAGVALLLVTVVYFATVTVGFNTIEDRYRLPIDAFLMILACGGLGTMLDRVRAHRVESRTPPARDTRIAA